MALSKEGLDRKNEVVDDKIYDRMCGIGVSRILNGLGLIQKSGESNWEFRKRAFPMLWQYLKKTGNESLAMEFLLLLNYDYWDDFDKARLLYLSMELEKENIDTNKELEKFANGFSEDPVEWRREWNLPCDYLAQQIAKIKVD